MRLSFLFIRDMPQDRKAYPVSSKQQNKLADEQFDELEKSLGTGIFGVKENYKPTQHKRPSKTKKVARDSIDIAKGLLIIAAICAGAVLIGYLLARSQPEIICKQMPNDSETVCKQGEDGEWYFPK